MSRFMPMETPEMRNHAAKVRSGVDIENRFSYHPPKPGQGERYGIIRDAGKTLALTISAICPESRELSTALTKVDEAVMFANAAIARNEP